MITNRQMNSCSFRKNRLLLALVLVVSLIAGCSSEEEDLDLEAKFLSIGAAAPDFMLVTDDGYNGKRLSSFYGSYVVMEFWRSTCPDCREVTRVVKALYESYSNNGVIFIGVSEDTDTDKWKSYISDNGLAWIQCHDPSLKLSVPLKTQYGVSWVPTFYLIDKDGTVLYATCYVERLESVLQKTIE